MSHAVDILKRAEGITFVDGDGEYKLQFGPPLNKEEITKVAFNVGCALPEELQSVLLFSAGFEGIVESVDFAGKLPFESKELFPHGLPIAADGFGNFWVLDLKPDSEDTAVFFACHDPPVVIFQADSLAAFARS